MKYIKVVVGSNFGDEGKGMITHYFSENAKGTILNILHNGGVQRGHTVNGHIFHCFGSGTFDGASTYYHENFMANPIGWRIECQQLGFVPELYVNPYCRVTTPFDIAINQAVERCRANNKHGSCGMGIWETSVRHEAFPLYFNDLINEYKLYEKLMKIKKLYVPMRCTMLGITIDNISIDDFLVSSHLMVKNVKIEDNYIYNKFDTIIYEGGQGLLLDENNLKYAPHTTPSSTGSSKISDEINMSDCQNIEVCYVTRSYMTRHGVGEFDTECNKNDISSLIIDNTNVPNEFQDELRYGWINIDDLRFRIQKDLKHYTANVTSSIAVTQLNYTDGKIYCGLNKFAEVYSLNGITDRIYTFYHEI